MRKYSLFYIVLWIGILTVLSGCNTLWQPLNGRYTEELDFTVDAAGVETLDAETTNGDIIATATDTPQIAVHVVKTIRALTDEKAKEYAPQVEVSVEREGNTIQIQYTQPSLWKKVQVNVEYNILCPPQLDLFLETTNGAIRVTGVEKSVDARTTNGDATLSGGQGIIGMHTTNGSIHVERSRGSFDLSSTNGQIYGRLDSIENQVQFSTTNGNVDVEIAQGGAPIRATSTNGSVSITLPNDFAGQLDASTFNGHIACDFEIPVEKPSKKNLKGPIGTGGDPVVYLNTTNGNIEIKKK